MMRKPVLYTFLAALLLIALEGCGRKDYPNYPRDADERPAALPRRGVPVPYN